MVSFNLKRRFRYLLAILLYTICFLFSYYKTAVGTFNYFGFGNGDFSLVNSALIFFSVFIPASFMPLSSVRPSVYIYNILFFFIYVPMIVISNDSSIGFHIDSIAFTVSLFLSFMILLAFSYLPVFKVKPIYIVKSYLHPVKILFCILVPVLILIFIKLRSNFSIIGLLDVYDKRDAVHDLNLGFVGYLIPWVSNFIVPVLVSCFFINDRKSIALSLTSIYVFLFFTIGSKMLLLSVLYFFLSYGYISSLKRRNIFLPVLFSFILIAPYFISGESDSVNLISLTYEGLVITRTFLVQGLSAGVYSDFFSSNPFTFLSHLSIFNQFIDYPYNDVLPVVLDRKYNLGNYNAPFFVSDGYASFGFAGMIFFSILVGLYFFILDSVCYKQNYKIVIMSLSVFIVSMCNVSFATSLVSFGGIFFLMYNLFYNDIKRDDNENTSFS